MKLLPPSLVHIIYFIVEVSARIELTSLGYKARILTFILRDPLKQLQRYVIYLKLQTF